MTYRAVMDIDISRLDEAQLEELNRRIVARLKYLQEARTRRQMLSFNVGDRVSFHPPGHDPKTGVIVTEDRPYGAMPAANRWRRCPSARASASNSLQSSGGWPFSSILRNTR